jgi:hypothetical protein
MTPHSVLDTFGVEMNKKYTHEDIVYIKELLAQGIKVKEIVELSQLHPRKVYRIQKFLKDSQNRWKHTSLYKEPNQPAEPQTMQMSMVRFKEIVTAKYNPITGRMCPSTFSAFEKAATRRQSWDEIEWEGVLLQPDTTPLEKLISIQDNARKDRIKKAFTERRGYDKSTGQSKEVLVAPDLFDFITFDALNPDIARSLSDRLGMKNEPSWDDYITQCYTDGKKR